MKEVNLAVGMTCGGCSAAVQRILGKLEGVKDIEPDLAAKNVKVTCDDDVEPSSLVQALQKWSESSGKSVALAE
jgi:copper chaperone CopZ